MSSLHKIKLGLFALLTLALVIIVFQNLAETEVHLLFFTRKLPQAALLSATLLIGFIMGFLARELWHVGARRAKAKASKVQPE